MKAAVAGADALTLHPGLAPLALAARWLRKHSAVCVQRN